MLESRGSTASHANAASEAWDPRVLERWRIAWPVAEAARAFAGAARFPLPDEIDAALATRAGVRFVTQPPRARRARALRAPEDMYDAQIVRDGRVPTRPGSWHDWLNALVWATFPRAKRALHARQHRAIVPARPGESARRTRELDALALLDEGGVVAVAREPLDGEAALADALERGDAVALVFGHAVYESLVRAWPRPTASALVVVGTPKADLLGEREAARELIDDTDRALAAILDDLTRMRDPSEMSRLVVDDRLLPPPLR